MSDQWSEKLPVVQVRIARVTADLEKIRHFYQEGLGLSIIAEFEDHAGYSGVIFGLPGREYHLEFTQIKSEVALPDPHPDDLLVFYIPNQQIIGRLVVRLGAMGYRTVPPVNPYWEARSVTLVDPDGRRVVLADTQGL